MYDRTKDTMVRAINDLREVRRDVEMLYEIPEIYYSTSAKVRRKILATIRHIEKSEVFLKEAMILRGHVNEILK